GYCWSHFLDIQTGRLPPVICVWRAEFSCTLSYVFFFFSSRRRHTRWPRDWSSDVCSSDLFGPGIPIYTFATASGVDRPIAPGTCGGLHGHVRVSPDGTVYVPNENCFDSNNVSRPGVAVSTDNGLTWAVRTVPDAKSISPGTD